jgi:hypothetical protein
MLMELVRVGDATFTAYWWVKDNLINVATEMRTRLPQNQTRSATVLNIPLGAKFDKSVQMTNSVRV